MSLATVRSKLRDLARGQVPQPNGARTALALRGRWGVGKTHVWKEVAKEVAAESDARRFAYVSLFGVDSLDGVRGALATALAVEWVPSGPFRRAVGVVPKATGAFSALVKNVPYLRTLASAGGALAGAVAFELVRDAVVCFDDLERGSLSPKVVFGLVAHLRDERGCDVVVIVNDEQLGDDATTEFGAHGEKAIDLHVTLEPTPEEAFEIAFRGWNGPGHLSLVRDCCLRLDVSNVRVLYRVRATLEALLPRLNGLAEDTIDGAIRGAVLLTWARHTSEGEAPPYDIVKQPPSYVYYWRKKESELSDDAKAVRDLHARYGASIDGTLDPQIAHFVEKGWFDEEGMVDAVQEVKAGDAHTASRRRVRDAWALFEDVIGDNESEVVRAIHGVHVAEAEHVEPRSMDAAVRLLRELDRDDLADDLIEAYARAHIDNDRVLRWRVTSVASDALKDPAFIAKLDTLAAKIPDERTLGSVLGEMSLKGGWNPGNTEFLSGRPSEEYEAYFRSSQDGDLRHLAIRKCLQFGEYAEPNPVYEEIVRRARDALVRIAMGSRIDAMRVERGYGISIDAPPAKSGDADE